MPPTREEEEGKKMQANLFYLQLPMHYCPANHKTASTSMCQVEERRMEFNSYNVARSDLERETSICS